MTQVALITDLHFGARSDADDIANHQERFYRDVFFPHLDKNNIKRIFILGDVFDRRKYINFKTLHRAYAMLFTPAKERGIHIGILAGNHDCFHRDNNSVNSCDLLLRDKYDNVTVFDNEPRDIMLGENYSVAAIPWMSEGNYAKCQTFLKKTLSPIVFGHFDINGFEMAPGAICEHGEDPQKFARFDHVYSGHYHAAATAGNITYLGTQYDMDWGDYGHQKQFYILDTDTRMMTPVFNPFTIYEKFYYDDDLINRIREEDFKDRHVKLVFHMVVDSADVEKISNKINSFGPVTFQRVMTDVVAHTVEGEEGGEAQSTLSILKSAVAAVKGVPEETLKQASAIINDLYHEAMADQ